MSTEQVDIDEIHGIILTVAWFVLPNTAIWSLFFRSKRYAVYVHIASMAISAMLMSIGPILILSKEGVQVITEYWFHTLMGFIFLCILPLILLSGSVCKIRQDKPEADPEEVVFGNKAHSIFGWIFIIVLHVPLVSGWYLGDKTPLFIAILVIDTISYSTYFILKFKRKRIESLSLHPDTTSNDLRQIKSAKDLQVYSQNFFIFANYVYNISPVLAHHPGGWKIIEAIRGREVDRFLYGVDSIELYDIKKVSHTLDSIKLAGDPIAVLKIPLTYSLSQLNEIQISNLYCHDKKCTIYTLYLELPLGVKYTGYSSLSQIGQYYSLTINDKLTRLYTAVNFLQQKNLQLFKKLSNIFVQIPKHQPFLQNQRNTQMEQLRQAQMVFDETSIKTECIPLLIKKYEDGLFTSQLLSGDKTHKIVISQSRGLGLALQTLNCDNIVLLAGGTGLYPFSDLIDLVFKAQLVEAGHQGSKLILEINPFLQPNPFKRFSFKLYLSVSNIDELHPIILYELNSLSAAGKFQCYVRAPEKSRRMFFEKYPKLTKTAQRFEGAACKQFAKNPSTMAYICGPVRFTRALLTEFMNQSIAPSSYHIV